MLQMVMLNALLGLWPLVLLLVFVGVVYVVLRKLGLITEGARGGLSDGGAPGYRLRSLLTQGELTFYRALIPVVSARHVVMVKVRLADLVEVNGRGKGAGAARNRVIAKHVDFVLCGLDSMEPVLVIELDDATHDDWGRQASDAVKDGALASAGLPVLRVRAAGKYGSAEISRKIEACIGSVAMRPGTPPAPPA